MTVLGPKGNSFDNPGEWQGNPGEGGPMITDAEIIALLARGSNFAQEERMNYYILEGKTPIQADLMRWAKWFESHRDEIIVAQSGSRDRTSTRKAWVSTVSLGLDHQHGEGPPLIFETMIFGGEHDQWQERCSTWEEAEAMHKKACELAGVRER